MYIHRHIANNFWLKLFSLVLAALIWYLISFPSADTRLALGPFRPNGTRDFRRPVVVMLSANNVQAFRVDPTEVSVKVLGEQSVLDKLRAEDIEVFVNLQNAATLQEGSFRVEVSAPREVTIQQVWPAHVYVKPAVTPEP